MSSGDETDATTDVDDNYDESTSSSLFEWSLQDHLSNVSMCSGPVLGRK